MSAATRAWKAQDDRDRRSRMAVSSVNAPAKKDGAGGRYTWGGAIDVTDYEPVGFVGAPKVATSVASPTAETTQPSQATSVFVQDPTEFPDLGVAPTVTKAPAANPPPAVAPAPRAVPGGDTLRSGVAPDATHPRNTFARKPRKASATATAEAGQAPAIDWTASGTTSFQQRVIHTAAADPAHLGPYKEAAPRPPLSMLQAAPVCTPSTKLSKQVCTGPKFGRPRVMCQRKC